MLSWPCINSTSYISVAVIHLLIPISLYYFLFASTALAIFILLYSVCFYSNLKYLSETKQGINKLICIVQCFSFVAWFLDLLASWTLFAEQITFIFNMPNKMKGLQLRIMT
jgi:hypothetical protein